MKKFAFALCAILALGATVSAEDTASNTVATLDHVYSAPNDTVSPTVACDTKIDVKDVRKEVPTLVGLDQPTLAVRHTHKPGSNVPIETCLAPSTECLSPEPSGGDGRTPYVKINKSAYLLSERRVQRPNRWHRHFSAFNYQPNTPQGYVPSRS